MLKPSLTQVKTYGPTPLTRNDVIGIRYFALEADTGTGAEEKPEEPVTTPIVVANAEEVVTEATKTEEAAPAPVEEVTEEVSEPEIGSDGRIDAKEFEAFKKARNAENKSLRDRLRNLERNEIIRETGLTAEQLDLLKGETPEELRKSAEAFKVLIGAASANGDKKEEPVKTQPKTFNTPPKASGTPAANVGTSDIVQKKDYNALKEILNQGKK